MTPVVLRADQTRLALRLPSIALGVLAIGAAAGVAGGSRHSAGLLAVATLAFGCLRFWAARTQLVLDGVGVKMSTPLATWHVAWTAVESVGVTEFLTPTHRGGVGAGAVLHLGDGTRRSIPDIFSIRREEIARMMVARRAAARSGKPRVG